MVNAATDSTSTVCEADGSQSAHASQLANAGCPGLRGGPGCRRPRRGRATWPRSTSRWSPTTAWSCCGPSTPGDATPTWCGILTDPSFPGWAAIIEGGRDLHLGDLDPERPDRRQHVPRVGVLGPGGHPGDPARRRPRPPPAGRSAHPGDGRRPRRPASPTPRGSFPTPAGPYQVAWRTNRTGLEPVGHRPAQRRRPVHLPRCRPRRE